MSEIQNKRKLNWYERNVERFWFSVVWNYNVQKEKWINSVQNKIYNHNKLLKMKIT